jgi:hypothetical protein
VRRQRDRGETSGLPRFCSVALVLGALAVLLSFVGLLIG